MCSLEIINEQNGVSQQAEEEYSKLFNFAGCHEQTTKSSIYVG
jgi:hypothetical protein